MTRSLVYNFYVDNFNTDYTFLVFFIVIFLLSVLAYELGFARKLSVLKTIIVYIILLIGTYITTIFAVFQMPIVESLLLISFVFGIYRLRMYIDRKKR